jgi:chromosome segregation ATPase
VYAILIARQVVKLNKQLETAAADQSKLVIDYEVQIRDLSSQLEQVNESKSKLELEIEEIQRRTLMDADERMTRLQDDLKVCNDVQNVMGANRKSLSHFNRFGRSGRLTLNCSLVLTMRDVMSRV